MKIVLLVDKQTITRVDKNVLISDSNNYVFVQFVFDFGENPEEIYDKMQAIFWHDEETKYVDIDGIDGICMVPNEFLTSGSFKISLCLSNDEVNITTNRVTIDVGSSGFGDIYKPDAYSKLDERIKNLEKTVASISNKVDKLEEKIESGDQNDNVGEGSTNS